MENMPNMEKEIKLRECPFCGGEASLEKSGEFAISIHCKYCFIETLTTSDNNRKSLIKEWNTRPAQNWDEVEKNCKLMAETLHKLAENQGKIVKVLQHLSPKPALTEIKEAIMKMSEEELLSIGFSKYTPKPALDIEAVMREFDERFPATFESMSYRADAIKSFIRKHCVPAFPSEEEIAEIVWRNSMHVGMWEDFKKGKDFKGSGAYKMGEAIREFLINRAGKGV